MEKEINEINKLVAFAVKNNLKFTVRTEPTETNAKAELLFIISGDVEDSNVLRQIAEFGFGHDEHLGLVKKFYIKRV